MEKFNTFYEDMPSVWGDNYSVTSEIGKLRTVLVHRPGKEIENIKAIEKIRFHFVERIYPSPATAVPLRCILNSQLFK